MDEMTAVERSRVKEARALCDELLRDFETVMLETKQTNSRLLPLAFAWASQVHRFVRAALVLHDQGYGHEALVLHRQALEFTVRLHWLTQVGDRAVDSVLADYQSSVSTLATDAAGGPLNLPEEFIDDITDVAVDSTYAFGKFRDACDALGVVDSLYALYRHLSKYAHPTWAAATFYMEDQGEGNPVAMRTAPLGNWDRGPTMLAALVIWSTRSVDDLINGKPRRRALQKAARRLGVKGVLPHLQKPPRKTRKK